MERYCLNAKDLHRAATALRRALPRARPVCGLILGSGWSAVIDDPAAGFVARERIAYAAIPGLGRTRVAGHAGRLVWGTWRGLETFVFQGRRHWYEGAGWTPVALPIYLLKKFGAAVVVLTNAAGGIRAGLRPGALMIIDDHINAMGVNPLVGPPPPGWGERFPDQSEVYDIHLRALLDRAAGRRPPHGIYLAVSGPTYETPAEIRAFRKLGAAAVGMSTVPETMLARAAGLRVAGISLIANAAAGRRRAPLAHAEILSRVERTLPGMRRMLGNFWKEMANAGIGG